MVPKVELSSSTAPRLCARLIFSSTFDIGMYIFKSKNNITRDDKAINTEKAAFSNSVN